MAIDSTLRSSARLIRAAIRAFAKEKGWAKGSYRIYLRTPRGGVIHVLLVSDHLAGRAGFSEWHEVREHLEKVLADAPELLSRVRLGVRSAEQVAGGGLYSVPQDYAEITGGR